MNIVTATSRRPEIAAVWCLAVRATLTTPHTANVLYSEAAPACPCPTRRVDQVTPIMGLRAADQYGGGPVRMFLEEDMIPVRPWSVDDYPGRLLAAEGSPGRPWPSLVIKREQGQPEAVLVPQRFVRDGGCPDWLPADLCQPALDANAKVLGRHFLHLDKMYRANVPEAAAKDELLELLRRRFSDSTPETGLGDLVAAGLSAVGITEERVTKAIGRPCGCSGRRAALNEWGRKVGLTR